MRGTQTPTQQTSAAKKQAGWGGGGMALETHTITQYRTSRRGTGERQALPL